MFSLLLFPPILPWKFLCLNVLVKTTVRIPEHIINDLKEAGKKHYRNFNSEL